MRRMVSAGVLMALVFLIPAAPAAARAETSGLDAACQTVERKIFEDIRELVTIDLDTATDIEVRVVANQIMSATKDDSFPVLPPALQERLDGTGKTCGPSSRRACTAPGRRICGSRSAER
jgi:hypothetical protein